MQKVAGTLFLAIATSLFVTAPAWAGVIPPGVPAPVIGLGLPALIGMGMLYRRLRKRSGDLG